MSPEQITRKLEMIANLPADEIEPWRWGRRIDGRAQFPGEEDALRKRERESGVRK